VAEVSFTAASMSSPDERCRRIGRSINEAGTLAWRVWLFAAGRANDRSSAAAQCVANM